ncbi:MAG: M23 family metallopeptidase [Acidimicrobiia bacterium]
MADKAPMWGSSRRRPGRLVQVATVLALAVVFTAFSATPASAHDEDPPVHFSEHVLYFPVIGEVHIADNFGAPRDGYSHAGVDIMTFGVKGLPVVAANDGTVGWVWDECCAFQLIHDSGWSTWYIHLNNDTPGTDDGLGEGLAPGIAEGARVVAGQLVGWVGDSGNAEDVAPHLHFELRDPDGVAYDTYEWLLVVPRLEAPLPGGFTPPFWDDDTSVHEEDIIKLAAAGVTKGCNPPSNDMYCPDRHLSRGEITAFLRRILDLPSVEQDFFTDDSGGTFEDDINALAAAGIAFGCTDTEYCSGRDLTRAEMAELMVRAFEYPPVEEDFFTDDQGHPFEASIDALKAAGITVGCNPPDNTEYCPERPLSRAEMATFLVRALGL